MVISVPLLTPADVAAFDSRWWSRMAVLCDEVRDGGLVARGICDSGLEMAVKVRRAVLASAPRIDFVEYRRPR